MSWKVGSVDDVDHFFRQGSGTIPCKVDHNLQYYKQFIELRKSYKATPTSSLLVTNLTIADLILLFQLIHQVKNDINGGLRKVFKTLHLISSCFHWITGHPIIGTKLKTSQAII